MLRAAEAELYEVLWSEAILEEVRRNLIKSGRTTEEQAQKLVEAMDRFFPTAKVRGFEHLIPKMTNDVKDRHVLAAAVAAEADIIVTSNLKDFGDRSVLPYRISVLSTDRFLMVLLDEAPEAMTRVITEQASQLKRPPKTAMEVLDELELPAPQFAAAVRDRLR